MIVAGYPSSGSERNPPEEGALVTNVNVRIGNGFPYPFGGREERSETSTW